MKYVDFMITIRLQLINKDSQSRRMFASFSFYQVIIKERKNSRLCFWKWIWLFSM